MSKPSFGPFNPVAIDNETFLLQSVEFEDETVFLLKRGNEIFCMIMLDENNQWQADTEMSDALFQKIMHWINKLYLEQQ
jgi:hypothetical protein